MFVEAAPSGQLPEMYRKALKEACLKVRIVGRAGRSLRKILTKLDPFHEEVCKFIWNVNCKGRGVVTK